MSQALPVVAESLSVVCEVAYSDMTHFAYARDFIIGQNDELIGQALAPNGQTVDAASQALYLQLSNLESTKGMTLFRAIEGFSGAGHEPIDEGTPMPAMNFIESTCAGA